MRTFAGLLLVSSATSVLALFACSDASDGPRFGDVDADADAPNAVGADAAVDGDTSDSADAGNDATIPPETVRCAATPCVVELAARGGAHVCARFDDGTVACWGADNRGQLGIGDDPSADGDPTFGARPTRVKDLSDVTQLSVFGSGTSGTSCARSKDGAVRCWGANMHGQLALPAPPDPNFPGIGSVPGLDAPDIAIDDARHSTPIAVEGITNASRVDVGGAFVCAVTNDDAMKCWGDNTVLQLGRGYLPKSYGGVANVRLGFRKVSAGAGTARNGFAISTLGELLSWGGNTWQSSGTSPVRDALARDSSLSPDGTPTPVPALAGVTHVVTGAAHACAVAGGAVHCWGGNATGALGNGTREDRPWPTPVTIEPTFDVDDVAVSAKTTCAHRRDGSIHCWGDNARGQLGSQDSTVGLRPVRVDHLGGRPLRVVTMDDATCALLVDGSVECWGDNTCGQLGLGARDDLVHPTPTKVEF